MKYLVLVVMMLAMCSKAHAEEDVSKWTATDIGMQAVYTTLHVMDWGQTRDMTPRLLNGTYQVPIETNPILGKYPSNGDINTYFITAIVLHTAVSHYIPRVVKACGGSDSTAKYSRTVWQAITIGFEGGVVASNARLGVKIQF